MLAELVLACESLEKAADEQGLRLNHRTGTHIHLGWLGKDVDEVKRALLAVRLFEPEVATLVAPSRLVAYEEGRYDVDAPNPFCQPVSRVFTARRLARVRGRCAKPLGSTPCASFLRGSGSQPCRSSCSLPVP